MNKKCFGCGVAIQTENSSEEGYTTTLENKLCKRCFDIKNYNTFCQSHRTNQEYLKIINNIKNGNDLVIYLTTILSLSNIENINTLLNDNVILVITKKDVLPKSVKEQKIINYIKQINSNILDIEIISSIKNYNIDNLFQKIKHYAKTNRVYVVGEVNVGKSTLINKLIYNYSKENSDIIVSPYPETTLDVIEIKLDDNITLIDTPGIINEHSILYNIDNKLLKEITLKKEIKPITIQVKQPCSIIVGDILRIDYLSKNHNSLTFYLSNSLKINKYSLENDKLFELKNRAIKLTSNQDIVIPDLGFIKLVHRADLKIYIKESIVIYQRNNLI